eukprot:CAMPEP_0172366776 /NCGR_PEP_ID=MMETSP1060-20121228/17069_1 /TAXON_ID=37318 /ORGANISM="Pseudo-nitzschia pungens, Strain cf. cingulata" /LENGTH=1145 /DNA_ID=CAMNT_0013090759 /DNA_START=118 /DNA_END=3555 /DNA_ORIENTATION=+
MSDTNNNARFIGSSNGSTMIATATTTTTTTTTTTAEAARGPCDESSSNGGDDSNANGPIPFGSQSEQNSHDACSSSMSKEDSFPSWSPTKFILVQCLKFLLLNGPLMACWALLLTSWIVKEVWKGPLEALLESYKLSNYDTDGSLGTFNARDNEMTYYYRRCDHRDISTHDANDLLIDPGMTLEERKNVVMTHGAAVMKDILGHETASELRTYLETRHHEYHSNNLDLPWDELFWDGDNGSRLSLGLGPEDGPIIARAIAEVGSNAQLKRTLEATLGPDPAVVEVSTLSTMHDAEPQGIHTDSDWFGSSVLYTRTFLHSYTMFIALQDTTSRMGATTICPGTHWCADEDLYELCQCNFLDEDFEEEYPIGYCNTFEASSNGQTGLDVGVLRQGDAMMFNQNVWHRGPRNFDEARKKNRVMFIMTFVSRRDFEKGDNRQQGWGTYYYMRHSMWGHLFSDLKTAASGGMDLFKSRIWKAYGLLAASKKGNLPWLEHWARQMANDMDFFRGSELGDFRDMLRESQNPVMQWLFLDDAVLKYLFGNSDSGGDDDDIGWKEYLELLVESSVYQSRQLYFIAVGLTALVNTIGYALYCAVWYILGRNEHQRTGKPKYTRPTPVRDISMGFGRILVGHLLVLGIAVAVRHYVLFESPLFKRIHNGEVFFKPFPSLPVYKYSDETGERFLQRTMYAEVFPVDALVAKQDREQRDFRMSNPKHPYAEYYNAERKLIGYKKNPIMLEQMTPMQNTAFPERMDVLVGSRYDARFLASMNSVLDFHPGNKAWIKYMSQYRDVFATLKSSNSPGGLLDLAAETILSKILDGALPSSSLSADSSVPRRFLKQDPQTGWWVVMRRDEAARETKRALLSMAHPKTIRLPYEHWKEVIAEARFGVHRQSVMARKWIPLTAEKRIESLFSHVEDAIDTTRVSPMNTTATSIISHDGERHLLLPSTARGLLPKSIVTGRTAVSMSLNSLESKVGPAPAKAFREHLKQLREGEVTLKLGDHILYKGREEQNTIYQATIVGIDAEEGELEIQPLRNDADEDEYEYEEEVKPITRFVTIDEIQFYRPLREDDYVWALTENPGTEDETWKIHQVLFVSPFGQAEIKVSVEYLNLEDDDEEYYDDPMNIDVRDLYLHDDEVPKIRLRQY